MRFTNFVGEFAQRLSCGNFLSDINITCSVLFLTATGLTIMKSGHCISYMYRGNRAI